MLKRSLQLRFSQQLALTPQLQQSIRLLQLSSVDLLQEMEQWLQSNPLLERGRDADDESAPSHIDGTNGLDTAGTASTTMQEETTDDAIGAREESDRDTVELPEPSRHFDDDDSNGFDTLAEKVGLKEHLLQQLRQSRIGETEHTLVQLLIECLDEDGYLHQSLQDICPLLPENMEAGQQELTIALRLLQSFDPPGVGARDARECLLLQLDNLADDAPAAVRALARKIVDKHLQDLASHNFNALKRLLACTPEEFSRARELILTLNPHPGAGFAQDSVAYIVPDIVVKKKNNLFIANLNLSAVPSLRIHQQYAQLLRQSPRGEKSSHLNGQLQEARWLIKSLRQRFDTILRVSQVIVDHQQSFFKLGPTAMRPLVLRDVAKILQLHESTVSRVTNQKYMATPRGVFELKYFFSSSVATDVGGSCSSISIRSQIETLVKKELGSQPLSDTDIVEALRVEGIQIARRTVAKYRAVMNIPPAHQRKSVN